MTNDKGGAAATMVQDVTGFECAANGLERVRTEPRANALALVSTLLICLAAAWFHWLGLILGGVLVGLAAKSLSQALIVSLGFGVVVFVAFAVTLGPGTWKVLEMTPITYVTVGATFGLPLLGSTIRGVL